MSFILDALKKSETERQQQGKAEFSSVPTSSDGPNPARWLWLLAALLVVNFAVLIGVLLKPGASPEMQTMLPARDAATTVAAPPAAAPATSPSFADQVAEAVQQRPAASPVVVAAEPPASTANTASTRAPQAVAATTNVPTIDELRLKGTLTLPELHLDIHVYSDDPASRFVFINMSKQHEGSRIAAGPQVTEITPDGVILEYQGQAFLLPRE
jgi:general secretion pathway protein B